METLWLAAFLALWAVVFFLGFLLLGALRALGRLSWRLEQLEATTPRRIGRDGLKPGKKAPDFTLPGADGKDVSLHDYAGRKVLLVFTHSECGPCRMVAPELNRLGSSPQVLVVNEGDLEATRRWSGEVAAGFPVLAQEKYSVSRQYQVFATPFAFLIDEKGIIASKGIVSNRQHIRYVLSDQRVGDGRRQPEAETDSSDSAESSEAPARSSESKEVNYV